MLHNLYWFLISYFTLVIASELPNFVIVITDDQDVVVNGMEPMKKTRMLLAEKGATFQNMFTTSPVCCPSRASLFSGLYQHNHHVINNTINGGCSGREWQELFEDYTFANVLKKRGYSTYFSGKYMNQYGKEGAGGPSHIPSGWDKWFGLVGNSKYYNYTISINGIPHHYSKYYLPHLLEKLASDFIRKQTGQNPFLMVIAPPAPHAPFTPEPKYKNYYEGKKIPRTEQFNTANNKAKHWLARMDPSPLPDETIEILDRIYSKRLETLLSIDDLVETVLDKLMQKGLIDNTYIMYTSDNGFHLGHFAMGFDKRQLYEFDIRVPLIVRGPGIPHNITVSDPVLLLDISPTILHLVGFNTTHLDGKPFLPLKETNSRLFLIEYHGEKRQGASHEGPCWPNDNNVYGCPVEMKCKCQDSHNNTYSCLRYISPKTDFIFCQFEDDVGFEEAYNLINDPMQMENIANKINKECKMQFKEIIHYLKLCRGFKCSLLEIERSCVIHM